LEIKEEHIFYKEYTKRNAYAVTFSESFKPNIPMIKGRFIDGKDIKTNQEVAVIGQDLKERINTIERNGKEYVSFEGQEFEIVGIMGVENEENFWNNKLFVNFSSFINAGINFTLSGDYYLDAGEETQGVFNRIYEYFRESYPQIRINEELQDKNLQTPFIKVLMDYHQNIVLILTVVVVLALNIFHITDYWLFRRKREMAVRKLSGCTNIRLALRIIFQYIIIVSFAYIIGFLAYFIVIYFNVLSFLHTSIYFSSTIVAYFFTLGVGLLTTIIPIKRMQKIEIRDALR